MLQGNLHVTKQLHWPSWAPVLNMPFY